MRHAPFHDSHRRGHALQQISRDDLVMFDCRAELGNVHWGEAEYAAAHLPGAHLLHLDRDLSSPMTTDSGRHPLPDPDGFARRLGQLGVDADCQLVAYDQGNGAYAARLWWLARWIGLRNVAVLDGGIAAWRAAGLPVEQTLPRARARSRWRITRRRRLGRTATRSMSCAGAPEPARRCARARNDSPVATRRIDPVAGHIPGARNIHFSAISAPTENSCLRRGTAAALQHPARLAPPAALIAMCGSGVTACHNLLALEHAGLAGARLYAGSWSEWIRDPRRPIATAY